MRYLKGSVSLRHRDRELLHLVADARYMTHLQLFQLARLQAVEFERPIFNWRVRRLVKSGLLGIRAILWQALPAKLTLNPELPMNDDEYYQFCMANPSVRVERTAQGEIVIVPPAGGESDYQTLQTGTQLNEWARRDGRGKAFGASVEFILPTGAALSPDAAWVSNQPLNQLSRDQRRKFPPVCPEFVIEVMSAQRPAAQRAEKDGRVDSGWRRTGLVDLSG